MTNINKPISKEANTLRTVAKIFLGLCVILAIFCLMIFIDTLSNPYIDTFNRIPNVVFAIEFAGVVIFPLVGVLVSARLNALATITEAAQLYKNRHAQRTNIEQSKEEGTALS